MSNAGHLSVQVMPQAADRKLQIKTDTASMEVLGTTFSLMVQGNSTALEVDEGRVCMQRLVDGQTIEVSTKQVAVATLNTATDFVSQQRKILSTTWRYDANAPLLPPSKGTWQIPNGTEPGFVRAEPYVAGHRDD